MRQDDATWSISSLAHLHEALSKRSEWGWVRPNQFPQRCEMLSALDVLLQESEPIRYDYVQLKHLFIQAVRRFSESSTTEHYRFLSEMPAAFRQEYDRLTAMEWFSFIDIIDLCARFGKRQDSELIQSHGLLDEMSYAEWNRTRMIASNSNLWPVERDVCPVIEQVPEQAADPIVYVGGVPSVLPALQHKMLENVEVPGLSLLGTLTADDIVALREKGRGIFQLRALEGDAVETLQRRFIAAVLEYWDAIGQYIRDTRPVLATDKTMLALFLRKHLPTMSRWGGGAATFAIDLGLDAAAEFLKGFRAGENLRARVHDILSLRFLFYGETSQFRSLKRFMPEESWLLERAPWTMMTAGPP